MPPETWECMEYNIIPGKDDDDEKTKGFARL